MAQNIQIPSETKIAIFTGLIVPRATLSKTSNLNKIKSHRIFPPFSSTSSSFLQNNLLQVSKLFYLIQNFFILFFGQIEML